MMTGDTIAAISSAVGMAARMIVRLSGPDSRNIAAGLCGGILPGAGEAVHAVMTVQGMSFPLWVYGFLRPHSYTGEDLIEFHLPGNPLLARMVLGETLRLGARAAEAGEFTARAYFNGRIDLTEAEGVAATIAAHSRQELLAARQLLAGELAKRLRPTMDQIAQTLALVEAGIDFSDEDVAFLTPQQIADHAAEADAMLEELESASTRFERLAHEPQIVLIGRPNAGKSTLLNVLAGQQRAVVSPVPGTTRDAIWAEATLPRGRVRIIDVAGMGDNHPVDDEIEQQMHQRASESVATADVLVLVREAADKRPRLALDRSPDLVVASKSDQWHGGVSADELAVSAQSGSNMDELRRRLDDLAFGRGGGASLALNARHLREIKQAREALSRITVKAAMEVAALDLRESLDALGRVIGSVSPDDLLGRIFSTFCIGK